MKMKITKLLKEYKALSKEIKMKAKRYNELVNKYNSRTMTKKDFQEYEKVWKEILEISDKAYNVMLAYRYLSDSVEYKVLFALGIVKKQNTFRYIDKEIGAIKVSLFVNMLRYERIGISNSKQTTIA